MNKQIILILLTAFATASATAQEQFIVKGKIEFEKKTNLYKQIDMQEDDDTWRNMIKKMVPQTKTNYFDLYFNDNKTVYMPGREVVEVQKVPEWFEGPGNKNIVYTDIAQQNVVSEKTVFDDVFNITDSTRKLQWKITPDKRTIANFACRKATTIILDSVFVVAFYTDQIVTSGGPESFQGLPGMILGLVIPRLNTTWFATKLELTDVKETFLIPPKKGKKTNYTNLKVQLNSVMKNWGKQRDKNLWQIMI